jgi:predicted nucleic acid-binding protein
MNTYLLDTNTVSYFLRGMYADLTARMQTALNNRQAAISSITRAEIRFGQQRMTSADKRRAWIDLLLQELPVLPWGEQAADCYGTLKQQLLSAGRPIGELDTLIAAQALSQGQILVTHNLRHFQGIAGLQLEDWVPNS